MMCYGRMISYRQTVSKVLYLSRTAAVRFHAVSLSKRPVRFRPDYAIAGEL